MWLFGVIAIVGDLFPTEQQWREASEQRRLGLMRERDAEIRKIEDRCRGRPDDSPAALASCLEATRQERLAVHADYLAMLSRVGPGLEHRLANDLLQEQVRSVLVGAGLWAIPLLALYALGTFVAWLRRRFRVGH
jgi:hypothetical protein